MQILRGSTLLAVSLSTVCAQTTTTAPPIKHLVVIFQENVSFDHYFATYPNALNGGGEPLLIAGRRTPRGERTERSPVDAQSQLGAAVPAVARAGHHLRPEP